MFSCEYWEIIEHGQWLLLYQDTRLKIRWKELSYLDADRRYTNNYIQNFITPKNVLSSRQLC